MRAFKIRQNRRLLQAVCGDQKILFQIVVFDGAADFPAENMPVPQIGPFLIDIQLNRKNGGDPRQDGVLHFLFEAVRQSRVQEHFPRAAGH